MMMAATGSVHAADLLVLDSSSAAFRPGQSVAADAKLGLAAGQSLSLMTPSGRILRVAGPAETIPAETDAPPADDRTVLASLSSMVKSRQADTRALGTFRVAGAELPDPWLVDVSGAGERCILEGEPLVFWRPDGAAALLVTVERPARQWRAQADWPAGSQRLLGPDEARPADGEILSIGMGKGRTELTVHVIPAQAASDAARLSWLVRHNCMGQATALVRQLE